MLCNYIVESDLLFKNKITKMLSLCNKILLVILLLIKLNWWVNKLDQLFTEIGILVYVKELLTNLKWISNVDI